jgi:mannose-6-phosphate isomerase-like protein (cupin superfamily)
MREDYVDTKLTRDYKPDWSDLTEAGSARVAPGDRFDRHYHDGAEYWLIFSGRALLQVGEDQFTVAKGDIVATPSGVEHDILAIDPDDHLELFYVATAIDPDGHAGDLHRGHDFDHEIGNLREWENGSTDSDTSSASSWDSDYASLANGEQTESNGHGATPQGEAVETW